MPLDRDPPPHMSSRARSRSPRRRDDGYRSRDDRGDRYERKPSLPASPRRDRDRRRGDDGYDSAAREREREGDRKRYDEGSGAVEKAKSPVKPNFANSGLLAKESNMVKGVALKYHEPPEARKPTKNWRLYVFKGDEQVDLVQIYNQSCYLVGRDTVVTDITVAHPSCSKQHAVIQFRQLTTKNEYGDTKSEIKPYLLDLDSTNGSYVNGQEIPKSRYYELRASDVIKFGTSSREYVLLHEDAK